ncbi:Uma2 family endonuclease [Polyangium sp. 6x1]|uniref:Uma2 family endonuclease n=1 Tax=Polyangium sp. 6x1 TaxID=3042689 RepID=UPI0024826CB3|nr:Uma2 family endonuclease [Polyangium sp. 6x1]MDI1450184.1 Uma2 family endonuclease [Polyangium sp. 6x1]
MAADAARKRATYEDLLALPPNVKGEILDGVLYTQPRPRFRHMRTATILGGNISSPFDSGWTGPGGWWIVVEPGIELPDSPEVSPDIAGWRRERMLETPEDGPITVVPDWVCEILSPSTRRYDEHTKKWFYARHGVSWLWLIDPDARLLTAHRLQNGGWFQFGSWVDDDRARIEPFESVELSLSALWTPKDN